MEFIGGGDVHTSEVFACMRRFVSLSSLQLGGTEERKERQIAPTHNAAATE